MFLCASVLAFGQRLGGRQEPQRNVVVRANTIYVCKGGHPRCEVPFGKYGYPQFGGHILKDFVAVSEILPPGKPEEHHQSFLAEIISQRPRSNAVALWGDATAAVDNAVVWGGFNGADWHFELSCA